MYVLILVFINSLLESPCFFLSNRLWGVIYFFKLVKSYDFLSFFSSGDPWQTGRKHFHVWVFSHAKRVFEPLLQKGICRLLIGQSCVSFVFSLFSCILHSGWPLLNEFISLAHTISSSLPTTGSRFIVRCYFSGFVRTQRRRSHIHSFSVLTELVTGTPLEPQSNNVHCSTLYAWKLRL